MNRFAKLATITAVFAAAFALPSFASAQSIGSANIQKIFTDIKETKDLEQRLKSKNDDFVRMQDAAKARLGSLQDSRNQFKPGSAEYDRANQELRRTAVELQVQVQVQQQELLSQQKQQTKAVYDKAVAAVADVAKAKQLTIVIAQIIPPEPSDDQMERLTVEQLIGLLRQQNVLYVAPSVDITADVITRLDSAYTPMTPMPAGTPAPAPAPAPAPSR